jgi:hypothetical protein
MTPKPQPKANLIRQQILFALLEGKFLAKNVSYENVDILAKRWAS